MKHKRDIPTLAVHPPPPAWCCRSRRPSRRPTRLRELLAEAAAANTSRSCVAAMRYWACWLQARFGVDLPLPVGKAVVSASCRRRSTRPLVAAGLKAKLGPLKLATVVERVAVLSTAHHLKCLTQSM